MAGIAIAVGAGLSFEKRATFRRLLVEVCMIRVSMQSVLFAALFLVGALLTTKASASVTCTAYPTSTAGNGTCPSISSYISTPLPLPMDTSKPLPTPSNAASSVQGQRASEAFYGDPYNDNHIWFCYPALPALIVEPYCAIYNASTGAVVQGPLSLNSVSPSNNLHNGPGGTFLRNNFAIVLSGALAGASPSNNCFTSAGAAGSTYGCQYFNIGNAVGGTGGANIDITNSGSLHALASTSFSEPVCATWGPGTTSTSSLTEWIYCFGQSQKNTQFGTDAASVVGTVLYPVFNSTGTALNNLEEDTGIPGAASSTLYDAENGTITSAANGTVMPVQSAHNDVMARLTLTASGTGTGGITITLPSVGTFTGATCTWTGTTSATISITISNFVADFNGNTHISGCTGYNTYYGASSIANTFGCTGGANQCAYIKLKSGNPAGLAAVSGTVGSPNTGSWLDLHAEGSGFSEYQAWSMGQMINGKLYILAAQTSTVTDVSGGQNGNTFAPNLMLLCTRGPNQNDITHAMTFGPADCGDYGGPIFTAWAGNIGDGVATLMRLGGGTGGSCTTGTWPNCTNGPKEYSTASSLATVPYFVNNSTTQDTGTVSFCYDWAVSATSNCNGSTSVGNFPVASGLVAAINQNVKDGDIDLAYACGDSANSIVQVCFARIDPTTCGANGCTTVAQHFIENTITVQNAAPTYMKLFEKGDGTMVLLAVTGDGGNYPGCTSFTGTCFLEYTSSDNTGSSWTRSAPLLQMKGTNSAASVCAGTLDNLLRHSTEFCIPGTGTSGTLPVYPYDVFVAQ